MVVVELYENTVFHIMDRLLQLAYSLSSWAQDELLCRSVRQFLA